MSIRGSTNKFFYDINHDIFVAAMFLYINNRKYPCSCYSADDYSLVWSEWKEVSDVMNLQFGQDRIQSKYKAFTAHQIKTRWNLISSEHFQSNGRWSLPTE